MNQRSAFYVREFIEALLLPITNFQTAEFLNSG